MNNARTKIVFWIRQLLQDYYKAMEKIPDFIFDKFNEILNLETSLKDESDRGCALLTVSYLDNELKNLLEKRFLQKKRIIENLIEGGRPLSSFSSRIDLTFLIGLIGEKTHGDLNLIRKIRNEFAHKYIPITFEDPKIKSLCNQLYYSGLVDSNLIRVRFVKVCVYLLALIHTEYINVKPFSENKDLLVNENSKQLLKRNSKLIYDSIFKKDD